MVRRLKNKQRHGCEYCRKEGRKVRAVYTNRGLRNMACAAHKGILEAIWLRDQWYDDRDTEADFQLRY